MILLPSSKSKALVFLTYRYYQSAIMPSPTSPILHLLQILASCGSLGHTKQCHAQILSLGFAQNPFLATKLISAYGVFRVPEESERVFNSIQFKSVYLWNSLINGYAKNFEYGEAFDLFCRMGYCGVVPDDYTLATMARVCSEVGDLQVGKMVHAKCMRTGFIWDLFAANSLMSMYCECGELTECRKLFDEMSQRNVGSWNVVLSGYAELGVYAKNHGFNQAFDLFCGVGGRGVIPDDYTLATMAKLCGEAGDLDVGKMIHAKCVRSGYILDVVAANSVMTMYCKCGELGECRKLFDEMSQRNLGSWNVVISGYAESGNGNLDQEIFGLVQDMQVEGLKPDAHTIWSLLPLSSGVVGKCDYGRECHAYVMRNELESDVHLGCCLIDMYLRRNKVCLGRRVFDQTKARSVHTWTVMMNGYVQIEALKEAFDLFRAMQVRDGVAPNKVSLVSVLPACSSLADLIVGKQIHGYAVRKQLNNDVSLCNALIDMYSKCGSLKYALHVFEDSSLCRDAISWSSMISGYGLHGKGKEAVTMYRQMLQLGNKPDMIKVVGVLSACSKSGLVDEGLRIYNSAVNEYGITPTLEICACVVDMLGRSGQLGQALDFIKIMPAEPGPSIWRSLLSSSMLHGNSQLQDLAYKFLIQSEPENPANYVSLSNLHASSERWGVVADVRTMMKERRLRKTPGCSWISINKTTHCFYATDKVHPCSNSIYEMLDALILLMKATVRSPDFEVVTYTSSY